MLLPNVVTSLPASDIQRLQSVRNSSVQLVTGAGKYDLATFLLRDQHRLPIAEQIRVCTLTYWCLQGNALQYLADHEITPLPFECVAASVTSDQSNKISRRN
jgi:hypothetical protein